jgi:hypothetical protein
VSPGRRRDALSGIICIVVGLGAVLEASRYTIGSLSRMGPGFYPAVLGALLALVGVMITGAALAFAPAPDDADPLLAGVPGLAGGLEPASRPDWRGWFCIIAGGVLFIVFASLTGLASAIFACVFVAALGDRTASLRGSLVLALCMTLFGTVLFGYLLRIAMPLWQWPSAG